MYRSRNFWAAVLLVFGVFVISAGCSAPLEAQTTGDDPEVSPDPPADETEVVVFFSDWQAQHTVPELRAAQRVGDESLAEVVVRELIAGPEDLHLHRALPADTRVLSVHVEGETVYVNLSEEVRSVYGSAGELMAVRSLVYSLTELDGIDFVQILIEGEKEESLAGHMTLDEPQGRGEVLTFPILLDDERAEWLQSRADEGIEDFRTDLLEAVRFDARMLGFESADGFAIEEMDEEEGSALVAARRDGAEYLLRVIQPVTVGEDGIWIIESVEEE